MIREPPSVAFGLDLNQCKEHVLLVVRSTCLGSNWNPPPPLVEEFCAAAKEMRRVVNTVVRASMMGWWIELGVEVMVEGLVKLKMTL